MSYLELNITITPYNDDAKDILQALLGEIEFESFEDCEGGFKAYIKKDLFSEQIFKETLDLLPIQSELKYESLDVIDKNWNETWEKNYFQPIEIEDQVYIRSSFHTPNTKCKYEILIDPKMSFGTGHHSTTWLVAQKMTRMDFSNKSVLDMGCGTGILAILASMKGAEEIVGIDIDEWSYKNCIENIRLNQQNGIQVRLGGADQIADNTFDIILANINRNILLNDMPNYANALNIGGTILFSGFYTEDLPLIKSTAKENLMEFIGFNEKKNWVVAEFKKVC